MGNGAFSNNSTDCGWLQVTPRTQNASSYSHLNAKAKIKSRVESMRDAANGFRQHLMARAKRKEQRLNISGWLPEMPSLFTNKFVLTTVCVIGFLALAATLVGSHLKSVRQVLRGARLATNIGHKPGVLCRADGLTLGHLGLTYSMDMHSWTEKCKNLPTQGLGWENAYSGVQRQNMCWSWMKKVGCYDAGWGSITWKEAQERTAQKGLAPWPNDVPMHPLRQPDMCDKQTLGGAVFTSDQEKQQAGAWFDQAVSVYVVNLPSDIDRWKMISARLSEVGIAFTRIPGIDLRPAHAYEDAKAKGLIPNTYNLSLAQANANSDHNRLGGVRGTVGCAVAHLNAHQVALEKSRTPLALIFEDDVRVEDDFKVKLWRLLKDEAPCDWSAISLKAHCPHGMCVSPHLSRVHPDGNEPADRCRHGVNYGFFAMLYQVSDLAYLSSRLQEVVYDESRPHCLDIDVALASISDELPYYAVPGVQSPGFLQEGGFGSSRTSMNTN